MDSHHNSLLFFSFFLRCSPAPLTGLVWKGRQALESRLTVNNNRCIPIKVRVFLFIFLLLSFLFFSSLFSCFISFYSGGAHQLLWLVWSGKRLKVAAVRRAMSTRMPQVTQMMTCAFTTELHQVSMSCHSSRSERCFIVRVIDGDATLDFQISSAVDGRPMSKPQA